MLHIFLKIFSDFFIMFICGMNRRVEMIISYSCLPNKLFKSDSQHVAFLLCVGFSV